MSIFLLSIAGAVLAAVIGTLWYSDKTPMGKIHMQYLGFDKLSDEEKRRKIEEAKPKMPKVYSAQIALSFLTAFAVVFITTMSIGNGVTLPMVMGFILFNWLCFVVPTIGTHILWGNCDPRLAWKKLFSDSFSVLATLLITAYIASFFA